ncbi:FkbM family methyltransferase [Gramella sp. MT6]|uniref:FkbM family methyltransferase n=1 Tax=Gramella sp. MT6 TaxID=2705471 RepID=UPI001C5E0858|nr:FkbM family methyltransferase [Gramella sp. MT6]QYA27088.1 FkbM family methyltransferase [Gramella sp. MT6]
MTESKRMDLKTHFNSVLDDTLERNLNDTPKDYFSWGRDSRHRLDNSEKMPWLPQIKQFTLRKIASKIKSRLKRKRYSKKDVVANFNEKYSCFENSYQLMSDNYSRQIFTELILMAIVKENRMRLSSFSKDYIDSYEFASKEILNSKDYLNIYDWELGKVSLGNPKISIFTSPVLLAMYNVGRLYRYEKNDVIVEVNKGDTVIDAGVGWGDTTIYLAALADPKSGGKSYAFDILEEGMNALSEQCKINKEINNITQVLKALSDKDDETVNISSPSPGARIVKEISSKQVQTITIDSILKDEKLERIDFIKMDIEGAEIPALKGASRAIQDFKPKLAISVYHKWDDLLEIPKLINSLRKDYKMYLDCTTGFGGEAVLYCI